MAQGDQYSSSDRMSGATSNGGASTTGPTTVGQRTPTDTGYTGSTSGMGSTGSTMPSTSAGQTDVGTAVKDTVQNAASQVQQQTGQVVDQARNQLMTTLSGQKDQLSQNIGGVGVAIRQLGDQLRENEGTAQLAQYADMAAEQLSNVYGFLNDRNVDELAREVENFARRQPGLFLGGAFALGLLAARFLKSSSQQATSYPGQYGPGGYYGSREPYSGSGSVYRSGAREYTSRPTGSSSGTSYGTGSAYSGMGSSPPASGAQSGYGGTLNPTYEGPTAGPTTARTGSYRSTTGTGTSSTDEETNLDSGFSSS